MEAWQTKNVHVNVDVGMRETRCQEMKRINRIEYW